MPSSKANLSVAWLRGLHEPTAACKRRQRAGRAIGPAAADVWALGICLFLMVSGIYPFEVCEPPASKLLALDKVWFVWLV